ncbi:MAG: imidazole glycerol phosphate synthase subunit HisH [Pirellula sp.]|jgi:glutamine amidotransferase|nr:imidazole glycerol phosphate synthase subunit HisH [Pirellula sp.]
MSLTVGIVDYQMGNLRSVAKAIEKIGATAIVSSDPAELEQASHLILPGVGAIGDAIRELKQRNLVPWIKDWIRSDRPFLGICLGMQLLFDYSEEGGRHEGLSVLPGRVIRFRNEGHPEWEHRKIPHMGWNQVWSTKHDDAMLDGIGDQAFFYFVHSYYVVPDDSSCVWLQCEYGHRFCAAVRVGNMMATQFHPEKSQGNGLRLLTNFLSLTARQTGCVGVQERS